MNVQTLFAEAASARISSRLETEMGYEIVEKFPYQFIYAIELMLPQNRTQVLEIGQDFFVLVISPRSETKRRMKIKRRTAKEVIDRLPEICSRECTIAIEACSTDEDAKKLSRELFGVVRCEAIGRFVVIKW